MDFTFDFDTANDNDITALQERLAIIDAYGDEDDCDLRNDLISDVFRSHGLVAA